MTRHAENMSPEITASTTTPALTPALDAAAAPGRAVASLESGFAKPHAAAAMVGEPDSGPACVPFASRPTRAVLGPPSADQAMCGFGDARLLISTPSRSRCHGSRQHGSAQGFYLRAR